MNYKKFALQDVLPNPFRDLRRFPVKPEKVDKLKESYKATGFWENIEGREVKGKLELAYGHSRVAALRQLFKPTDEFYFIVRELSDADMIQRMARENSEVYGADISSTIESVRATVQAFASGVITLGSVPKKTPKEHIRYAPSFLAGAWSCNLQDHPYTLFNVANFLGHIFANNDLSNDIRAAFYLLELEEAKVPGWTKADSSLVDKLRNQDGAIPADRALTMAGETLKNYRQMRKAENAKAAVVKQAGMTTQQRVDEEKARKAGQKAAQEILDKQHAADVEKILEEEARQEVESAKQAKKDNLAREKRRKEVEEQFEKDRQSIANSAKALQQAEHLRSKREEAARSSFEKTLREIISRFFSEENPAVEMQKRGNKTRTDKERELLDVVLDRGHDWIEYARKHNRIEPKKKETK